MLTRRFFIGGMAAAFAAGPRKLFAKEEAEFDDNLLVFLSDVHAGAAKTCKCARKKLKEAVAEVGTTDGAVGAKLQLANSYPSSSPPAGRTPRRSRSCRAGLFTWSRRQVSAS